MKTISLSAAQKTMLTWKPGELYLVLRPDETTPRSRPVNRKRTTASKLLRDAQCKGVRISALERSDGTVCYRKE